MLELFWVTGTSPVGYPKTFAMHVKLFWEERLWDIWGSFSVHNFLEFEWGFSLALPELSQFYAISNNI